MHSPPIPAAEAVKAYEHLAEVLVAAPPNQAVEIAGADDARRFFAELSGRHVHAVAVPTGEHAAEWIERAFRRVLTAAATATSPVVVGLLGRRGALHFIVATGSGDGDPALTLLEGAFPGARTSAANGSWLAEQATRFSWQGRAVALPPPPPAGAQRRRLDVPSLARTLQRDEFNVWFVARPLDQETHHVHLREVKSRLEEAAAVAQRTEQAGTNEAKTTGSGSYAGGGVSIAPFGMGVQAHAGKSWSQQDTQGRSFSTSVQRIDTDAEELAALGRRTLRRLREAAYVGYWDVSVLFSAASESALKRLQGTLAAVIAEPCEDPFPPVFVTLGTPSTSPLLPPIRDAAWHPSSLSACLTSDEFAALAAPPCIAVPGVDVVAIPPLGLTDPNPGGFTIGDVSDYGRRIPDASFSLSREALNRHVFVCGTTGSGKSTTVQHLLRQFPAQGVPFLVVEAAKRDYRRLAHDVPDLRVYTVGEADGLPLQFNPFYLLPGADLHTHLDNLRALFNASFGLYGPMPFVLERALHRAYEEKGWDLRTGNHPFFVDAQGDLIAGRYSLPEHRYAFPTADDLVGVLNRVVRDELNYDRETTGNIQSALVARVASLTFGAKAHLFNTHTPPAIGHWLGHPTVFELEGLADDNDKAFFMGLVVLFLASHRQVQHPYGAPGLEHVLVLEEAHRLLKNVAVDPSGMQGSPRAEGVERLCNVLAEMRGRGQAVVVAEQIPSKIASDVLKNTGTKVVHRLPSGDDQALLAATIGLDPHEASYLNRLPTGSALCHKEGLGRPVAVGVPPPPPRRPLDDGALRARPRTDATSLVPPAVSAPATRRHLALRLLNTVLVTEAPPDLRVLLSLAQREIPGAPLTDLEAPLVELLVLGAYKLPPSSLSGSDGPIRPRDPLETLVRGLLDGNARSAEGLRSCIAKHHPARSPRAAALDVAARLLRRAAGGAVLDFGAVSELVPCFFLATSSADEADLWRTLNAPVP